MNDEDGLICAYALDGKGGGRKLSWEELRGQRPPESFIWVHLQRTGAGGRRWLYEHSGIDRVICDALLGSEELSTGQWIKEGHPRIIPFRDGLTINLRGMNLNPGAEPSDMVAVRAWLNPEMAVTVRQRHVMAIDDIKKSIATGNAPRGPGDFIVMLGGRLVDRMTPALTGLQEQVDDLEETVLTNHTEALRARLGSIRRRAIAKSRYIVPQRDALTALAEERGAWLDESQRARLRGVADRISRHVATLGFIRERAAVVQDEIASHIAEKANRTMFLLSLIAGVFLPITFITGLLGMNVGGVPWLEWAGGFWTVTGVVCVIAAIEVWILRRFGWF